MIKKLVSLALTTSLLVSSLSCYAATNSTYGMGIGNVDKNKFQSMVFTFDNLETMTGVVTSNSVLDVQSSIRAKNISNLNLVVNKIQSSETMFGDNPSLKKSVLKELDSLKSGNGYIESYALYYPQTRAAGSYNASAYGNGPFGSLDGYNFSVSYSVYNQVFSKRVEKDSNFLDNWFNGMLNIGISFGPTWVGVPVSILQLTQGDLKTFRGGYFLFEDREQVTSRKISIQDKDKKASLNQYAYVLVLTDMEKMVKGVVELRPASPYGSVVKKKETALKDVYTPNFYSEQKTRQNALGAYYQSPTASYVRQETVPNGQIVFKK